MSRGDTSAAIAADPISPEFQNTAPLRGFEAPPLTPEEKEQVDKMMTETPQYQELMDMCGELKTDVMEAGAQVIAIIELVKEGEITQENPEKFELAIKVMKTAAEAMDAGKAALDSINSGMKESGLPLGGCAMKGDVLPGQATPQAASPNP